MEKLICKLCSRELKGARSLKAHLQTFHNLASEFYTLQHLYDGARPNCLCGCGNETRYYSFGYKKYRTGHNGKKNANSSNFIWETKKVREVSRCVDLASKEVREKYAKTVKERYGVTNPYQIDYVKEKASKGVRECIFKRTPQYQVNLYKTLKNIDSGFEIEYQVGKKFVDICHPIKKIAIECDGDYIHSNPAFYGADYFNKRKNKLAKEIWEDDKNKKIILEQNGYKVFSFWQSDILENQNKVVDLIREELLNYG